MSKEIKTSTENLPAAIADLFTNSEDNEGDLSGGITGNFAIVSIRGSKWRIKYQGSEEPVVDEDGEPKASLEVIMVDASPKLSKIYYAQNYSEGDSESPDCSSINGEVPDAGVRSKQAENCTICPHNQWGSRITESGKKAKACHDSRRVAVVPAGDIENERYGGPMLLRIPAASLGDLKTFDGQLRSKNINYRTIAIRLGFDMNASYPKLTFKAVRRLTEDEMVRVASHITSGETARILEANDIKAVEPKAEDEGVLVGEAGTVSDNANTAPPKKKAAKKKAAKKQAAEPAHEPAETVASSEIDDELDSILGDLDNLT